MTDREMLQLILEKMTGLDQKVTGLDQKVTSLDQRVTGIETNINSLKRQAMKSKAELKAMDELILDEVERVHEILERHKADRSKHTA